jgi:hypothetical protein
MYRCTFVLVLWPRWGWGNPELWLFVGFERLLILVSLQANLVLVLSLGAKTVNLRRMLRLEL